MGNIKFKRDERRWRAFDRKSEKEVEIKECERREYSSLSFDEFRHEYLEKNKPLIITGALGAWDKPRNDWGRDFFKTKFGDKRQHVKLGQAR